MDIWKLEMRKKKRGDNCIFAINRAPWSVLCGCGGRTPPKKDKKTRIVKRSLDRQFREEIRNMPE